MSGTNTISTRTTDTEDGASQKASTGPHSTPVNSFNHGTSKTARPHVRRKRSKGSMIDEYFVGPRDTEKHSKLPYFARMHGSVTLKMIVPLVFVGCWATLITCISEFVYPLVVNNVLLTVLGFVVGLAISFRTSSAYERYIEGRKYWAQLIQASRTLAGYIWVHVKERHEMGEEIGKADLLAKLTALNLLVAFSMALKHKLRFEPYTNHPDLVNLVSHLSTYAGAASTGDVPVPKKKSWWKATGEFLGLTIAESNPRKLIKRSSKNLGNLPLEIITYFTSYLQSVVDNDTLTPGTLGMIMASINSLNEVLAGTERVLNTPLPIAYTIAISQITWVYVLSLPFQLWSLLRWVTIPGTVVGAYIILGIAAIGREIENPFGQDVNDLPLDRFCQQLKNEIEIIASHPAPTPDDFIAIPENRVLHSLGYQAWKASSVDDIRARLRARANTAPRLYDEHIETTEKEAGMIV